MKSASSSVSSPLGLLHAHSDANAAIVDGYLLPDSLAMMLASGEVNDVPLIFGVMHEEVDLAPLDVVFNMSTRQYQAFIMQKYVFTSISW